MLEEKNFRLQQEQERLTLETENAKSEPKDNTFDSIMEATPGSSVRNPIRAVSRNNDGKIPVRNVGSETMQGRANVAVSRSTLNHDALEWHQRSLIIKREEHVVESNFSGASSSPSEEGFQEILELHQHQNAIKQQQNRIMEMLAMQQKKSNLPQQRIPVCDSVPIKYDAFARAFENAIETKASNSSERLY